MSTVTIQDCLKSSWNRIVQIYYNGISYRICCTDKNGLRDTLLSKIPPLRRYLRIVHTDTFFKILQLAATSLAVRKGSFFEISQICLLSLTVVFNGLPLFGKSDTDFVFRNLIQTLRMVLYAYLSEGCTLIPFHNY